jgi:hypothetical protein
MEYNKIIAVTGLPGLYELLSSKSDGAIVRSLDDKTTRFVSSRVHNFSHLESIEVYTVRDNVNLVDILKSMEVSTAKLPDEKDAGALKNYFTKVYPDLDFTRVYSSDLKKMVKWFQVLKANNIEIKLTEAAEGEDAAAAEVEEAPAAAKTEKKQEKGAVTEKKVVAEKVVAEKVVAEKAAASKKVKAEEKVAAPKKKAVAASAKSEAKAKTEKKEPAKKAAKAEAGKSKKPAKKK